MTATRTRTRPSPTRKVAAPEWTFGDRLRKSRREAGLELADMAQLLGVSAMSISDWENDKSQPKGLFARVERWAEITRVPTVWLLTGAIQKSRDNDNASSILVAA